MLLRALPTFSLRRFAVALVACAACAAVVPGAASAAQPGVVLPNPNLNDGTLERIQTSGAKHVRVFASWKMLEQQRGSLTPYILAGYDELANRMKAMNIGVYLVVTQTPAWASPSGAHNAPPPVAAYADFMRRLAAHFRGRVMGYEIWNEPNEGVFWEGSATPLAYTTLLQASYTAVKAADPGARVGVGGLIGNDYVYVDKLYREGAKGSFDFLSLHTDGACSFTDPRVALRDADGRISRWSFTGYREVRATMLAHGDDKPIWMTELGWQITSNKCPHAATDPGGVSAADQTAFLSRAYSCLAADPYVELGSWFSLTDFGTTDANGAGYGLFTFAGAARSSLAAFQRAGSAVPDRACGLTVDGGAAGIEVSYPTGAKGVSGDLRFKAKATDDQGVRTLAVLVDGKQVKVTARRELTGVWTGWRKLAPGPHTVTFKAVDAALNVSTRDVTVNRVAYGDGEPVPTRIAVGLYGRGNSRIAAGTLFTRPAEARSLLRGRMTIAFERKAGRRWRAFGAAAAGSVSRAFQRRRRFAPGRYRVVMTFAGYKSFKPTVARRAFTVR
ncbi:MAG TPA: cellulase family glycosylhydrolase [Solirubrobacteraceae bacterium]|nr:cellulase family glycosylhydrolase [Solirubrobacteraceae bacterium]